MAAETFLVLFRPTRHFSQIIICTLLVGCVPTFFAAEARFERWRWSNPLPHGNNVMDMFVSSRIAVQVGDGGSVYVQDETERWAPCNTGVTNYLRGVAVLGNRYIVVGENGCVLWSDDGANFQKGTLLPTTTDNWFEGVAASGQRAVAVGDNGSIYTSTNGITWTGVASGTTEWLRSVAFGASTFIAVGENGTILKSSSSATSWSRVSTNTTGVTSHLNRVRYLSTSGGNWFVAVGMRGTAIYSTSAGSTWQGLSSGTSNTLFDVAANSNGLLLAGDQEIRFRNSEGFWTNQITDLPTNAPPAWTYYAAFGTNSSWLVAGRAGLLVGGSMTNGAPTHTWTVSPTSSHAWLWDVTVQQGICVAAGDLATIQTSLDGILWASEAVPGTYTNLVLLGVGGNTNLLLAAGNGGALFYSCAGMTNMTVTNYVGTNVVITNTTFNTLGMIWTKVVAFTTNTLQGVAASSSSYLVCGDGGSIFTSPNGTNWTSRVAPTTDFLSGVAFSPVGWVCVGKRGTLLRSVDGVSWTKMELGTTNWLYRVRYVGGAFVALGQNGSIYTSTDSITWTSRSSGTKAWLNDATYMNGKWWIVGTQGLLLSSSDLFDWTTVPVPTVKSLYAATTFEGKLLCLGVEGVVLRNQIEPISSPVQILGYDRTVGISGIGTNAYSAAFELFLFGGMPDQFFHFLSSTNMGVAPWITNATLEVFDPSGTIYLIRTRNLTNAPGQEYYRTIGVP